MSSIYPLADMDVGDVIVMHGKSRGAANRAVQDYRRRHPEAYFRVQTAIGGIAISRMPDRPDEPVTMGGAYIMTQDRQTEILGPVPYPEAKAVKPSYEAATGQTLVIVIR